MIPWYIYLVKGWQGGDKTNISADKLSISLAVRPLQKYKKM